MPTMISVSVLPGRQAIKTAIVESDTVVVTPSTDVAVYIGGGVKRERSVEITEGWTFLLNGIRERNLLAQTDEVTGAISSAIDIDSLGMAKDRRTSWDDNTPVTADDIAIGIGHEVAQAFLDNNLVIDNAFTMLSDWAKENGVFITVPSGP